MKLINYLFIIAAFICLTMQGQAQNHEFNVSDTLNYSKFNKDAFPGLHLPDSFSLTLPSQPASGFLMDESLLPLTFSEFKQEFASLNLYTKDIEHAYTNFALIKKDIKNGVTVPYNNYQLFRSDMNRYNKGNFSYIVLFSSDPNMGIGGLIRKLKQRKDKK